MGRFPLCTGFGRKVAVSVPPVAVAVHLIDVPVGQFSNERESQNRHSSKGIFNLADSLPAAARSEILRRKKV